MSVYHITLASMASLIWGATFLFTDAALQHMPPLLFAALRFCFVLPVAFVVPRPNIPYWIIALAGIFLGVGQYGFQFLGMAQGVTPGLASLLAHTQAFFTIAIAALLFREQIGAGQLAGIALGIIGFAVLVFEKDNSTNVSILFISIMGAVSGAVGNNILKSIGGSVDILGVVVWMSIFVPIPLFLCSVAVDGWPTIQGALININLITILSLIYSAVFATIIAFVIWGKLLTLYPASVVAPFFLLVPVFGIFLSIALKNEPFGMARVVGCGFIFAGLIVSIVPRHSR